MRFSRCAPFLKGYIFNYFHTYGAVKVISHGSRVNFLGILKARKFDLRHSDAELSGRKAAYGVIHVHELVVYIRFLECY